MSKLEDKTLNQYRMFASDAAKLEKEITTQDSNCRKMLGVIFAVVMIRVIWIGSVNSGVHFSHERISMGWIDAFVLVALLFCYYMMHSRLHRLYILMASCHGSAESDSEESV